MSMHADHRDLPEDQYAGHNLLGLHTLVLLRVHHVTAQHDRASNGCKRCHAPSCLVLVVHGEYDGSIGVL